MLEPAEIAEFYAYFIPNIPARVKDSRLWVGKAAAAKDIRNYLNYTYSDGKRLIGCDGHRLHWIETEEYKEGFYIPATLDQVEDQGDYPGIDKVIPDTHSRDARHYKTADFEVFDIRDFGLVYDLPNGTRLKKQYVDQAFNRDTEMRIYLSDPDSMQAVKLESLDGIRHAAIMPIKK